MTPENILRDKLRKIEALFAGAATPGEKDAAVIWSTPPPQPYTMLLRNLLYTASHAAGGWSGWSGWSGKNTAVAITVRNIAGRRRWSKLSELLRPRGHSEMPCSDTRRENWQWQSGFN